MFRRKTTLISIGLASTLAAPARAETLSVDLRAVRSSAGEVQLDLFGEDRHRVARKRVPARPGSLLIDFPGLRPGAYIVYVYHDENGNGRLDTGGLLGMPIEGYAFSNDAPIRMGPPSVREMTVRVPAGGQAVTRATMRYRR